MSGISALPIVSALRIAPPTVLQLLATIQALACSRLRLMTNAIPHSNIDAYLFLNRCVISIIHRNPQFPVISVINFCSAFSHLLHRGWSVIGDPTMLFVRYNPHADHSASELIASRHKCDM